MFNTDPHQSEYLAAYYKRIGYLSGFTGSNATVLVTADKALLWTDSRYFVQAEKELDKDVWTLMKQTIDPSYVDWILENLGDADSVGVDPKLISTKAYEAQAKAFFEKSIKFQTVEDNLVDTIWTGRPAAPAGKAYVHEIEFAVISVADKLK